jgi:hypothetical protein
MNSAQNQDELKDQNVLSFMMQLVQEKHGADTDSEFLTQESNRLYDSFGDELVTYFEPMLSDDQKVEFDKLVEQGGDQEQLLNFLIQSIPELEKQIMNVLVQFRSKYLAEASQA